MIFSDNRFLRYWFRVALFLLVLSQISLIVFCTLSYIFNWCAEEATERVQSGHVAVKDETGTLTMISQSTFFNGLKLVYMLFLIVAYFVPAWQCFSRACAIRFDKTLAGWTRRADYFIYGFLEGLARAGISSVVTAFCFLPFGVFELIAVRIFTFFPVPVFSWFIMILTASNFVFLPLLYWHNDVACDLSLAVRLSMEADNMWIDAKREEVMQSSDSAELDELESGIQAGGWQDGSFSGDLQSFKKFFESTILALPSIPLRLSSGASSPRLPPSASISAHSPPLSALLLPADAAPSASALVSALSALPLPPLPPALPSSPSVAAPILEPPPLAVSPHPPAKLPPLLVLPVERPASAPPSSSPTTSSGSVPSPSLLHHLSSAIPGTPANAGFRPLPAHPSQTRSLTRPASPSLTSTPSAANVVAAAANIASAILQGAVSTAISSMPKHIVLKADDPLIQDLALMESTGLTYRRSVPRSRAPSLRSLGLLPLPPAPHPASLPVTAEGGSSQLLQELQISSSALSSAVCSVQSDSAALSSSSSSSTSSGLSGSSSISVSADAVVILPLPSSESITTISQSAAFLDDHSAQSSAASVSNTVKEAETASSQPQQQEQHEEPQQFVSASADCYQSLPDSSQSLPDSSPSLPSSSSATATENAE